ncbi:hypothetical protein DIURU_001866 [Diutina rugosa]|uniref:Peptidase A1 domain-containing protein n=1 Tax=Diutina rugosa TaxID=5481 RepID=A0A642USX3_DIURU|nr:uncharacterized protein DIURU_001866 [Diutina rugosa]KAA8904590.1 hypothetical protein DIURU_001866 [Diutina rugosa]
MRYSLLSMAALAAADGTLLLSAFHHQGQLQFPMKVGSSDEEIKFVGVSEQSAIFINDIKGACAPDKAKDNSDLCSNAWNASDSKSLKLSDDKFTNNWYNGSWATDEIRVGVADLSGVPFGLSQPSAVQMKTNAGNIDIGALGSSFGYGIQSNDSALSDHSFIDYLTKSSVIQKPVFSVYSADPVYSNASKINFLYGGVDTAKYGKLADLDIQLPKEASALIGSVALKALYIEDGDKTDKVTDDKNYSIDLRYSYSAVTDFKMPKGVWDKVKDHFKYSDVSGALPQAEGDCISSDASFVFEFSDDVKVKIPFKDLQAKSTNDDSKCSVRMYGGSSDTDFFFGPAMLHHIYAVYDTKERKVSLGQMVFGDDSSVESVSGDLPQGKAATDSSSKSSEASGSEASSSSTPSKDNSQQKQSGTSTVRVSVSVLAMAMMASWFI